jgi:hypothetical protein
VVGGQARRGPHHMTGRPARERRRVAEGLGVAFVAGTVHELATDWTFRGLLPYRARWVDTPDRRIHYVDEGPPGGRPVVLVHGNPTWAFLYRDFIGPLVAAGHR